MFYLTSLINIYGEKKTKVRRSVNHNTYHRQCGMTKLCYLGVLSTVVLYLAFYLVLTFLVHICYCPRRKMILLWLKNLVMITIFYVLIYKKRVLFSQYRRYQIGKSFWLISTHHVAASFDTKRKKNWFPKKNSRF